MDRFQLQTSSDLALNYAHNMAIRVWGDVALNKTAAVNECLNCRQACNKLTFVPEFEIEMCDTCLDEAMRDLAGEPVDPRCPARIQIANESASAGEFTRLLRAHQVECVTCGGGRKMVVSDRLVLGSLAAVCCGEVA